MLVTCAKVVEGPGATLFGGLLEPLGSLIVVSELIIEQGPESVHGQHVSFSSGLLELSDGQRDILFNLDAI